MTGITLGNNLLSNRVAQELNKASSLQSRAFERLSTGLRINRASDDAAGLEIASSLDLYSRISTTALRNVNDGISALTIADAAYAEMGTILTRIGELATQASNGTLNQKQRNALNAEAQALSSEYARIINTTSFNGSKLFDGSTSSLLIQAGFSSEGVLIGSLGGVKGAGTFTAGSQIALTGVSGTSTSSFEIADLNSDGVSDVVATYFTASGTSIQAFLLATDGSVASTQTVTSTASYYDSRIEDVNSDGLGDVVSVGFSGGSSSILVQLNQGNGTFSSMPTFSISGVTSLISASLGDINGDGKIDIAATSGTGVTSVLLGNGNGTFSSAQSYSMSYVYRTELIDINKDGILDLSVGGQATTDAKVTYRLGNGNGTFGSLTTLTAVSFDDPTSQGFADFNNDGNLDIYLSGENTASGYLSNIGIFYGNGDGTFGAFNLVSTGVTGVLPSAGYGDFNGDGIMDIMQSTTADGVTSTMKILLGNGNGTFSLQSSTTTADYGAYDSKSGDFNGDGVTDIAQLTKNGSAYQIQFFNGTTRGGVQALESFSLASLFSARQTLGKIEKLQERHALDRSKIGASLSRFDSAIATLQSQTIEFQAAKSRISDVDVAHEVAMLTRGSILQQVGASLLRQSNLAPQLALTLLS